MFLYAYAISHKQVAMLCGKAFCILQEVFCKFSIFTPFPFKTIHVYNVDHVFWPAIIPDRTTGIPKLQQDVKISFTGIREAVVIIKELPGGANLFLPVAAMNDMHPVPFRQLVRMVAGIIYPN